MLLPQRRPDAHLSSFRISINAPSSGGDIGNAPKWHTDKTACKGNGKAEEYDKNGNKTHKQNGSANLYRIFARIVDTHRHSAKKDHQEMEGHRSARCHDTHSGANRKARDGQAGQEGRKPGREIVIEIENEPPLAAVRCCVLEEGRCE